MANWTDDEKYAVVMQAIMQLNGNTAPDFSTITVAGLSKKAMSHVCIEWSKAAEAFKKGAVNERKVIKDEAGGDTSDMTKKRKAGGLEDDSALEPHADKKVKSESVAGTEQAGEADVPAGASEDSTLAADKTAAPVASM